MPLLYARREVFEWLKQGKKTIDIRKGRPQKGGVAVFQSGPHILRLRIVKKESGCLLEVLRLDNYSKVIPTAMLLGDAVGYLRRIYGAYDGVFTAHHVEPFFYSEKC